MPKLRRQRPRRVEVQGAHSSPSIAAAAAALSSGNQTYGSVLFKISYASTDHPLHLQTQATVIPAAPAEAAAAAAAARPTLVEVHGASLFVDDWCALTCNVRSCFSDPTGLSHLP